MKLNPSDESSSLRPIPRFKQPASDGMCLVRFLSSIARARVCVRYRAFSFSFFFGEGLFFLLAVILVCNVLNEESFLTILK